MADVLERVDSIDYIPVEVVSIDLLFSAINSEKAKLLFPMVALGTTAL